MSFYRVSIEERKAGLYNILALQGFELKFDRVQRALK